MVFEQKPKQASQVQLSNDGAFKKKKTKYFMDEILGLKQPSRDHIVYVFLTSVQVYDQVSGQLVRKLKTCFNWCGLGDVAAQG